jgi:hypothetical protein
MKTDDLIRTLAGDVASEAPRTPGGLLRGLAVATAASSLFVGALIVTLLSPSPHLRDGVGLSIAVTVAVAATLAVPAFAAAAASFRPEVGIRPWQLLVIPAVLLLAGTLAEMARFPASTWTTRMLGSDPLTCFAFVAVLALPILGAGLLALRAGAPANPRQTGAAVGLLAGAVTMALYGLHCPEDSLMFVAIWHVPAVLLAAAIGAACGHRLLRW